VGVVVFVGSSVGVGLERERVRLKLLFRVRRDGL